MADISTYLRNIEEATLGEQVRGSIRDAISAINDAAEEGIEQAAARVGTPAPASTVADMEDTTKIYLYTGEETGYTAGHWYYYDGSAWTDGGAYNSPEYDYDRLINKPPIVVVDDDTPTDSRTNVWFDPTGEEIEVPTMEEFEEVRDGLTSAFSLQMLYTNKWINGSLYYQGSTDVWENKFDWKRYPPIRLRRGAEYVLRNFSVLFTSVAYDNGTVIKLGDLDTFDGNDARSSFTLNEDAYVYISSQLAKSPMLIYGVDINEYVEGYYDVAGIDGLQKLSDVSTKQERFSNLVDGVTITDGKYIIANNGGLGSLDAFKCSDYIELPLGTTKIYVKRTFHYGGDGLAFYNKNKVYISGYSEQTGDEYVTISVPGSASYIRLSAFKEETIEVYLVSVRKVIDDSITYAINLLSDFNVLEKPIRNKLLSDISSVTLGVGMTKVGNKIIHQRTTYGNGWWSLPATGYDTSKNMVLFSFDVIKLGEYSVGKAYLFGKTENDTNKYIPLGLVPEMGSYQYKVDLNYHVVYNQLDLSKGISFGVANNNTPTTEEPFYAEYENIFVYDETTELDVNKNLGGNLNDIVLRLDSAENDVNTIKEIASDKRVSPNGTKYIIQVTNDGSLITVPQIPNNILYIGNSLLLGFSTFGMAATRSSEDYYHYVNDYVSNNIIGGLTTDRIHGGDYEGCTAYSAQDTWLAQHLLPKLTSDLDLVIIQLGDNVNTDEKKAVFETGAKKLITYIREHAPSARVAWVAAWYTDTAKQTWISSACAERGATFIDISDLPNIEGNRNAVGNVYYDDNGVEHTITSSGVASHPSSQGMRQIADRIIATLFT